MITNEMLTTNRARFEGSLAMRAAKLAMSKHALDELVFDQDVANEGAHLFNHKLDTMKVTNQKSSGRCWLFAALNLFRECVRQKCDLEFVELSENYLAFYDKLEKANFFLDSILKTLELDTDDRLINFIVATGIQDGGQWDMMASLVKKYGLVPKDAMPETFMSSNTGSLNRAINVKLRRTAAIVRRAHRAGERMDALKAICDKAVDDIYQMLAAGYGCPPQAFDFEYIDKDKNYHRVCDLTPKTFFDEFVAFPFDEYVSLIHSPTLDKPMNRAYTVRFLGNVVGGDPITYVNADLSVMKRAIMTTIDEGESVWFGSDVGWFMERENGALVMDLTDYSPLFGGIEFATDKADKLDYRMSAMNHAMTITGYHEVDGAPVRWRIQNSWGDERGDKGYFMMNDKWFDNFVYQAVVKKALLPKEVIGALDKEIITLNPWDPMGMLAD